MVDLKDEPRAHIFPNRLVAAYNEAKDDESSEYESSDQIGQLESINDSQTVPIVEQQQQQPHTPVKSEPKLVQQNDAIP
jgi:hypothetical protein